MNVKSQTNEALFPLVSSQYSRLPKSKDWMHRPPLLVLIDFLFVLFSANNNNKISHSSLRSIHSRTMAASTNNNNNQISIVRVEWHDDNTTTTDDNLMLSQRQQQQQLLRQGVKELFQLYFDELYTMNCDLGFQGFQSELTNLPGKYDFNQRGGLFAAIQGQGQEPTISSTQDVVGCIALRPMEQTDTCGEVKRMYIRNSVRRNGIGHLLAATIIDHAWENGYTELKLDSLERLVRTVQ